MHVYMYSYKEVNVEKNMRVQCACVYLCTVLQSGIVMIVRTRMLYRTLRDDILATYVYTHYYSNASINMQKDTHYRKIQIYLHSFSINRCIRVPGDLFTWYTPRKYKLCSKQYVNVCHKKQLK